MWIPRQNEILSFYRKLQFHFPKLKSETLIRKDGLTPIIDKLKFGVPYLKQTIELNASIILIDLIKGHLFTDGNKRIGLLTLLIFINENGCKIHSTKQELFQFIMRITIEEYSLERLRDEIKKMIHLSDFKILTIDELIDKYQEVFIKLGE